MTDDELHAAWISGRPVLAIARDARTSHGTIAGRIRRLRKKEGEERWPMREDAIHRKGSGRYSRYEKIRAGAVTLPPLPSLRDC